MIAQLEKLLNGPRDGALLRFSLGTEHLKAGQFDLAIVRFREALTRDKHYSAAWKGLGKALSEVGQTTEALAVYEQGIATATDKGDLQAAREMTVFAKRLAKALANKDTTP